MAAELRFVWALEQNPRKVPVKPAYDEPGSRNTLPLERYTPSKNPRIIVISRVFFLVIPLYFGRLRAILRKGLVRKACVRHVMRKSPES